MKVLLIVLVLVLIASPVSAEWWQLDFKKDSPNNEAESFVEVKYGPDNPDPNDGAPCMDTAEDPDFKYKNEFNPSNPDLNDGSPNMDCPNAPCYGCWECLF